MNTCDCRYHRYAVAHICAEHRVLFCHSEAACNEHRRCIVLMFSSRDLLGHDDTWEDVFDRLITTGRIDYAQPAYRILYDWLAESGRPLKG